MVSLSNHPSFDKLRMSGLNAYPFGPAPSSRRLLLSVMLISTLITAGCDLLRLIGLPGGGPASGAEERRRTVVLREATAGEVTIYLPRLFADGSLGLQGVPRELEATDDPAGAMLQALIRGPTGDERAADFHYAIDRRTRVLAVGVDGGTGTIEFGEGLERIHGRPYSELVFWSIVYTLTEIPGVERVALVWDGRPLATLGSPPFVVPPAASRVDAPPWARPRTEG